MSSHTRDVDALLAAIDDLQRIVHELNARPLDDPRAAFDLLWAAMGRVYVAGVIASLAAGRPTP